MYVYLCILVIPQYEYNIIVITQIRGEAEDASNNEDTVQVHWGCIPNNLHDKNYTKVFHK